MLYQNVAVLLDAGGAAAYNMESVLEFSIKNEQLLITWNQFLNLVFKN